MRNAIFGFLVLLLVSCSNSPRGESIETPTITALTEEKKVYLETPDWKVRIEYLETLLSRAEEIAQGTGNEATFQSVNFLKSCTILAPREFELIFVKVKSRECHIVPLLEEDVEIPMTQTLMQSNPNASAYYHPDFKTIVLYPKRGSLDYTTKVLLHEVQHAMESDTCLKDDYRCRARNETIAYVSDAFVLDYLAMSKNSKYKEFLNQEAQKALEAYLPNGIILPPNYEEASRMREFFDSTTLEEDELWYTAFYLRKYLAMYTILYEGDFIKAQLSFVGFLETLLANGFM